MPVAAVCPGHAINYKAFNIEFGVCFSKEVICMRFASGQKLTIAPCRPAMGVSLTDWSVVCLKLRMPQ